METDTLTKPKRISKKESNSPLKKETKTKKNSKSYNQFKVFNGEQYSGMKVGRSHKWYYPLSQKEFVIVLLLFQEFVFVFRPDFRHPC